MMSEPTSPKIPRDPKYSSSSTKRHKEKREERKKEKREKRGSVNGEEGYEEKYKQLRAHSKVLSEEKALMAALIETLRTQQLLTEERNDAIIAQRDRDRATIEGLRKKVVDLKAKVRELEAGPTIERTPVIAPLLPNSPQTDKKPIAARVNITTPDLDHEFYLNTALQANVPISQVIPVIQRKIPPGNTDNFRLYLKGKDGKYYTLLEEDKTLASFKIEGATSWPLEYGNSANYKGKDPKRLRREDSSVKTILEAIQNQDVQAVKRLLTVDEIKKLESAGTPPLHEAIETGNHDLIEAFLDFYRKSNHSINAKNRQGWTALHALVSTCNQHERDQALLKRMLEFPGILVDIENVDQNTPLHYFAKNYKTPTCIQVGELLISKAPQTVNSKNRNGETPLHNAIRNDTLKMMMVKLLLNSKADPNVRNDTGGDTALSLAVKLGRKNLVKTLLQAGADPDIKDIEDKTPLDWAQSSEQYAHVAPLLSAVHELKKWLGELKLEFLLPEMTKADVTLEKLAGKSEDKLDDYFSSIGIELPGNRVWLTKACGKLQEKKQKKREFDEQIEALQKEQELKVYEVDVQEQARRIDAFRNGMTDEESLWLIQDNDIEYVKQVGAGASGQVFKGYYKKHKVAIKVVKEVNDETLEEFKKEWRVMSFVQHASIVHFFGASVHPQVCMLLEYCNRGSLYRVLNLDSAEISWKSAVNFGCDIALGLKTLHEWNPEAVFHRDIKSHNLMVGSDWKVKIGDMGLARFDTLEFRKEAENVGTLTHMAPEISRNPPAVYTAKSDIFSFAIVMWEIVIRVVKGCYVAPYRETEFEQEHQIATAVAEKGLRPSLPHDVPEQLKNIIIQAWSANPEDRPTASVMLQTLRSMDVRQWSQ
eukprot:TRINITY_DN1159_c0_g2_i1.p1 TRINITY_DN1159_c0_g2~~TRINITY_DN1159_c0_g2_i1.p1  ORF type:complete len:877 (+),score=308.98 TRINITY_DN1159_c0_g2_i1:74-2704(+)